MIFFLVDILICLDVKLSVLIANPLFNLLFAAVTIMMPGEDVV